MCPVCVCTLSIDVFFFFCYGCCRKFIVLVVSVPYRCLAGRMRSICARQANYVCAVKQATTPRSRKGLKESIEGSFVVYWAVRQHFWGRTYNKHVSHTGKLRQIVLRHQYTYLGFDEIWCSSSIYWYIYDIFSKVYWRKVNSKSTLLCTNLFFHVHLFGPYIPSRK